MFLVFVHLAIYILIFLLEIKDVCEIEELELSNDTDNKLIKNNNYAAKIDVLSSAASIFAEITWITNYYMLVMDDNHVAKIGILGPAASIFAKITLTTIAT